MPPPSKETEQGKGSGEMRPRLPIFTTVSSERVLARRGKFNSMLFFLFLAFFVLLLYPLLHPRRPHFSCFQQPPIRGTGNHGKQQPCSWCCPCSSPLLLQQRRAIYPVQISMVRLICCRHLHLVVQKLRADQPEPKKF